VDKGLPAFLILHESFELSMNKPLQTKSSRDNKPVINPQDLPDCPHDPFLSIAIGFNRGKISGFKLVPCKNFAF
jgi:hypothetical protein